MLQSGCLIYLNTLDISMEAVFHAEDKERLRAKGGRVPAFVAELLDFFGGTYEDTVRFAGCPVHDALCAAMLIDDSLIQHRRTFVDISCADDLTRGETVADIRGLMEKEPNCYISTRVNREKFVDMIIDHLARHNA